MPRTTAERSEQGPKQVVGALGLLLALTAVVVAAPPAAAVQLEEQEAALAISCQFTCMTRRALGRRARRLWRATGELPYRFLGSRRRRRCDLSPQKGMIRRTAASEYKTTTVLASERYYKTHNSV